MSQALLASGRDDRSLHCSDRCEYSEKVSSSGYVLKVKSAGIVEITGYKI